jgi:hypothetical protein
VIQEEGFLQQKVKKLQRHTSLPNFILCSRFEVPEMLIGAVEEKLPLLLGSREISIGLKGGVGVKRWLPVDGLPGGVLYALIARLLKLLLIGI